MALFLVSASLLSGCANPDYEQTYGARAAVVVVDSYDAEISAMGYSAVVETEYSDVEVGCYMRQSKADGTPFGMSDFTIGFAEFGDLGAIELNSSARFYIQPNEQLRPFAGFGIGITAFDDVIGVDLGAMMSLKLLGGVEIPFGENFFADLQLDYSIPIFPAEASTFPVVETEVDGLAIRIGIGVDFGGSQPEPILVE